MNGTFEEAVERIIKEHYLDRRFKVSAKVITKYIVNSLMALQIALQQTHQDKRKDR